MAKTFLKVLIATVLSLAVIGCSGPDSTPQGDSKVVKIGQVSPLTGNIAHLGKDNENGVRLAISEVNDEGVVIGGKNILYRLTARQPSNNLKRVN